MCVTCVGVAAAVADSLTLVVLSLLWKVGSSRNPLGSSIVESRYLGTCTCLCLRWDGWLERRGDVIGSGCFTFFILRLIRVEVDASMVASGSLLHVQCTMYSRDLWTAFSEGI